MRIAPRSLFAAVVVALGFADGARADTLIRLKNSFIDQFKDRATITADCFVDAAHGKPKKPSASKPSNDGDIHVATRCASIGLSSVSEVLNAADVPEIVESIGALVGQNQSASLTGVWRIWPEHGGDIEHIQGQAIPVAANTNPDHVFEIHPLTDFGGTDLRPTFHGIPDFTYKLASDTFERYEKTPSHITRGASMTTIETRMVGFNYVEFIARPLFDGFNRPREDGQTVMASILDLNGDLLAARRRLVFVAGTEPFRKFQELQDGQCMHVLGMPRLNLKLVWWRTTQGPASSRNWSLPYEMVVLGVLSDSTQCGSEE